MYLKCAGLVQLPVLLRLECRAHRPIRPVGLAPERALPVARLTQQGIPRDRLIVRRVEQIDPGRHVIARAIGDVMNQALLPRQPDDRRQERLRDAVRHVHASRLAPLGNDDTAVDDEAGGRTALSYGPDELAVRLAAIDIEFI